MQIKRIVSGVWFILFSLFILSILSGCGSKSGINDDKSTYEIGEAGTDNMI